MGIGIHCNTRGVGTDWCSTLFRLVTSVFVFLRVKAATALARLSHCNSVCPFVRPSVCHTGGSVKSGASHDHQIFTIGYLEDCSFRNRKAFP